MDDPIETFDIADLLVAYLEQLGIEYVFGIPGGAIEPLFNALARSERRQGPRVIVARHETGAAFMAYGYASNSKKIGVCCATTGPGVTNLITGLASAYANRIPILVITAQTSRATFGKAAFQESSCTGTNILGMLEFCTTYNTLVSHVDQFENKLCAALITAIQDSCPVHLSIPLDIHSSLIKANCPQYSISDFLNQPALVDVGAVEELQQRLLDSRRTVFVIGDDCAEAVSAILSISLLIDAKVVTTPHGKGLVNPAHPLYYGVIGFAGHQSAVQVLSDPQVDSIVAVGTALSEWASNAWDTHTLLNEKLIHVESDKRHFIHSPMARLHVRGKIDAIFTQMLTKIFSDNRICELNRQKQANDHVLQLIKNPDGSHHHVFEVENNDKCTDNASPIKPQRLMYELPRLFPQYTRYLVDTGNSMSWGIHYLHPFDRRLSRRPDDNVILFQSCLEYASMGWAIGSAIGAALAQPNSPVVCITGDGSFLMSGQEITVALQEQLTIIYMVLNDAALGMVKHGQQMAGAEAIGYQLPNISYCSMAKAMGINGYSISSPEDLISLDIEAICQYRGPTLLDVRIDADEIPPMGMRMKVLTMVSN